KGGGEELLDAKIPAGGVGALQAGIDPDDVRRNKYRSVLAVDAECFGDLRRIGELIGHAPTVVIIAGSGAAEGVQRGDSGLGTGGNAGHIDGRCEMGAAVELRGQEVVENSNARANRGSALTPRIPGDCQPRRVVILVAVIQDVVSGGLAAIGQTGPEVVAALPLHVVALGGLVHHTVVFPAQAVGQSQVRLHLPGVLDEPTLSML